MYMRLVQFDVTRGAGIPVRDFYTGRIIPALQGVTGCRYAGLMQSVSHPDQCISLTLWDNQEGAREYEKEGVFQQLMDEMRPYLSSSSDFTVRLSENLTLEYVPVPNEPVVRTFPIAERSDNPGSTFDPGNAMWLRIVSLKILPGKLDEFKRLYAEQTIPVLRKVKGCRHVYLLESDERSHEVLSVTRWDTQKDAEAYEESGVFEQLLEKQKHTLSGLYQWKRGLGKEQASLSATSDDVMVEHYTVLTGQNLR
ncbi:MAG: antibiotic biosynthesis monooxygenase family protein [Bacteroidota bacterium]